MSLTAGSSAETFRFLFSLRHRSILSLLMLSQRSFGLVRKSFNDFLQRTTKCAFFLLSQTSACSIQRIDSVILLVFQPLVRSPCQTYGGARVLVPQCSPKQSAKRSISGPSMFYCVRNSFVDPTGTWTKPSLCITCSLDKAIQQ